MQKASTKNFHSKLLSEVFRWKILRHTFSFTRARNACSSSLQQQLDMGDGRGLKGYKMRDKYVEMVI